MKGSWETDEADASSGKSSGVMKMQLTAKIKIAAHKHTEASANVVKTAEQLLEKIEANCEGQSSAEDITTDVKEKLTLLKTHTGQVNGETDVVLKDLENTQSITELKLIRHRADDLAKKHNSKVMKDFRKTLAVSKKAVEAFKGVLRGHGSKVKHCSMPWAPSESKQGGVRVMFWWWWLFGTEFRFC